MIRTDSSKVTLWLDKSTDPEFEGYAAKAFAVMWNTMNASVIDPFLADDVTYESQHVMSSLDGKPAVMEYFKGKLQTVKDSGPASKPYFELGTYQDRPCVTAAQGQKEPPLAVVLFKIDKGKIQRIDMCGVIPSPNDVERSGEYPVALDNA